MTTILEYLLLIIGSLIIVFGLPLITMLLFVVTDSNQRSNIYNMRDLINEMKFVNTYCYDGLLSIPVLGFLLSMMSLIILIIYVPCHLLYKIPLIKTVVSFIEKNYNKLCDYVLNIKFRDYE